MMKSTIVTLFSVLLQSMIVRSSEAFVVLRQSRYGQKSRKCQDASHLYSHLPALPTNNRVHRQTLQLQSTALNQDFLCRIPTVTTALSDDAVNTLVFIIGIIPFLWATNEFWRRIAVGLPFGTGKDSVVIKDDGSTEDGRRVLGRGAILVAYLLFSIATVAVGLSIFSVVSSSNVMVDVPPTQ